MSVRIYVFLNDRLDRRTATLRCATWIGRVDWPGAPRPGDSWFHCSEWGGETFDRVGFTGPDSEWKTYLDLEVKTTPDVLAHLVADHGFESVPEPPRG